MSRSNGICQMVVFLTSIICVVCNREDNNCNVDSLLCDVPTRLPGFIPSDCSHLCNFIYPDGGCRLDALCFFTSVVGLTQPAGYEHLLNLSSMETVEDAKWRVSKLFDAIGEEKQELDGLVAIVAATYLQFFKDKLLKTDKLVFPDEINYSPCSGFCKSFDPNGECNVNATCYFQKKLEQSTTVKNSPLLDFSSIFDDFDEYFLVQNLFERIKGEKMKLDTFRKYTISTFNVMVDIEVSNGDFRSVSRDGCPLFGAGDVAGFGGPGIVGGLRSSCSGVCMKTASNGDCVQDFECLLSHFNYKKN